MHLSTNRNSQPRRPGAFQSAGGNYYPNVFDATSCSPWSLLRCDKTSARTLKPCAGGRCGNTAKKNTWPPRSLRAAFLAPAPFLERSTDWATHLKTGPMSNKTSSRMPAAEGRKQNYARAATKRRPRRLGRSFANALKLKRGQVFLRIPAVQLAVPLITWSA